MILSGWRWGAAAAATFLLMWMAVGAAMPNLTILPYAPRRRIRLHRLFLAFAVGHFLLCGFTVAGKRLLPPATSPSVLLPIGAVSFSLILCQQTIRLSPPPRISWCAGSALCAAAWAVSG